MVCHPLWHYFEWVHNKGLVGNELLERTLTPDFSISITQEAKLSWSNILSIYSNIPHTPVYSIYAPNTLLVSTTENEGFFPGASVPFSQCLILRRLWGLRDTFPEKFVPRGADIVTICIFLCLSLFSLLAESFWDSFCFKQTMEQKEALMGVLTKGI